LQVSHWNGSVGCPLESVVNVSIAKILGIVTLIGWFFRVCLRKERIRFPRELWPLLLFIALGAYSLTYTTDSDATQRSLLQFITTVFFVFITVNLVRTREVLTTSIVALLLVTMGVGVGAIGMRVMPGFQVDHDDLDSVGVLEDDAEDRRVGTVQSSQGLTVHPGFYAFSLLIAIPLYCYAFQVAQKTAWRFCWLLGGILAFANLLLTYRRTGVLALIVIVGYLLLRRGLTCSPAMFAWLAVPAFCGLLLTPSSLWERMFSASAYDPNEAHNVESRLRMWEGAWILIQERWTTGVGLGNHSELQHYNGLHTIIVEAGAHNGYLQMLVELGVGGLLVSGIILLVLWKTLSRAEERWSILSDTELSRLPIFLKASFLAFPLTALTGIEFIMPMRDWWFVCSLGLVLVSLRNRHMSDESKNHARGS
jgi:O-antigen ligase